MAVTKTHPIKSTLKAAIDYILSLIHISLRQLFQKLHTLGFLRRLHYFLIGSIQTSKTDIFQQGGVKQVLDVYKRQV